MMLMLGGCASDPYWIRYDGLRGEVKHIVRVDFPCKNIGWEGCWNAASGTIEVKKGMPKALEDCVISHERKHAQGFTHERRIEFSKDCGDGTRWIPHG